MVEILFDRVLIQGELCLISKYGRNISQDEIIIGIADEKICEIIYASAQIEGLIDHIKKAFMRRVTLHSKLVRDDDGMFWTDGIFTVIKDGDRLDLAPGVMLVK